MPDMFDNVKRKWETSPSILIIYFLSLCMVAIGANHFVEDTWSSYLGLKSLEVYFHMNVQIFEWTYWTMSIAPQIAAMVFFYIYLGDTRQKKYLWMSIGSQVIDLAADVWYRSNEQAFISGGATIGAFLITFLFFTVGCEVFITVGLGLMLKLTAPVRRMVKTLQNPGQSMPSPQPHHKNKSKLQHLLKDRKYSTTDLLSEMLHPGEDDD